MCACMCSVRRSHSGDGDHPNATHTSVYEDASVSEHLLEWLVNVLPTGFAETAGDAACGELMPLMACVRYRDACKVPMIELTGIPHACKQKAIRLHLTLRGELCYGSC